VLLELNSITFLLYFSTLKLNTDLPDFDNRLI